MRLYKALIDRLKIATQFGVDTLLLVTRPRQVAERILIVRLDGIGDFVLWLDAARATVSHYKAQGGSVIFVAHAQWADWAEELGIFDEVIPLNRRRFNTELLYRYRFGRRIRRLGCVVAINPTFSREWLYGDAVIRICGAQQRIGSTGDLSNIAPWQRRLSNRAYTRLISAGPSARMELIRNAEFVRGLGEAGYRAKVADLHTMTAQKPNKAFIAANSDDQPYYVLFPGSSVSGKRWSLASFAQLADHIFRQTGWRGVVCGGDEDAELAQRLCIQCASPLLNWAGRTDLTQLTAILSKSQLLVANDTSATHIAAACGVPSVCIVGGGHDGRFLPYQIEEDDDRPLPRVLIHRMPCFGCNWKCIYGEPGGRPFPCIDQVTVAEVWREVSEILRSSVLDGSQRS